MAKTATATPSPKTLAAEAVAKTLPPEPQAAEVVNTAEEDSLYADILRRYNEAVASIGVFFELPGWKRTLIAATTYVAGCVGVAYMTTCLVEFVLVGAIALSAPIFLAIIVAVLAALLLVYYGHKAVMRVTGAILTKEADQRAIAAYDATRAMLRRFIPWGGEKTAPAAA